MATRRRKRRRSRGLWPPVELPELEQRHWDLIGLGLVAFAAFFACVFYFGWAGGEVGEGMADGILFLFGGAGYLAPIAMFAAGAVIVVRPMLPAVHPLKTGAACLGAALTLGLAAGSLGLGPGDTAHGEMSAVRGRQNIPWDTAHQGQSPPLLRGGLRAQAGRSTMSSMARPPAKDCAPRSWTSSRAAFRRHWATCIWRTRSNRNKQQTMAVHCDRVLSIDLDLFQSAFEIFTSTASMIETF